MLTHALVGKPAKEIVKQLRLRFGELPPAVIARVDAAEVALLDVWAERVITAARLDDVLGPMTA